VIACIGRSSRAGVRISPGDSLRPRDAFRIARFELVRGPLGTPGEIAALALYLASDEAIFTTRQCHVVDGGCSN